MSLNPRLTYKQTTINTSLLDSQENGNLLQRTVPTPADHSFAYDGVDSRTAMTSPLQKATTYTYDKSKNLTQITKPSAKTISNTYTKGRLESTSTPEGTMTYTYLFANKV